TISPHQITNDNSAEGMDLDFLIGTPNIRGNTGANGVGNDGIEVDDAQTVDIANNNVALPASANDSALDLDNLTGLLTVSGNTLSDTSPGGTVLVRDSVGVSFTGNTINESGADALLFTAATPHNGPITVSGNQILASGGAAVTVLQVNGNVAVDNNTVNVAGSGIETSDITGTVDVRGNDVRNTMGDGVHVTGPTMRGAVTISGNTIRDSLGTGIETDDTDGL